MGSRTTALAVFALAAAVAGCGGSSGKTGTLSLHLVDGPGDFQEINLHVLEVRVNGPGGWTTLSRPDQTWDLLTLRGGVIATLAAGVPLPAGDYSQVRLVLGSGNTVRLADGTLQDLQVPSGLQSGLKIVCPTHVGAGAAQDVFIDFDGARSIFLHGTGAGSWILRPVVRCQEKAASGTISGTLTTLETEVSAPLAGAEVTAQVLDTGGSPTVIRTATTGADGRYVLDLLPLGGTYYVVTQPVVGTASYAARASGPLALSAAAPALAFDAAYAQRALAGSIAGAVTPAATADDADEVVAVQPLDAGGTTRRLVVRTTAGAVTSGAESYAMPGLPVGGYSLAVTRRTLSGTTETVTDGAPRDATVAAGATTTLDLTVP